MRYYFESQRKFQWPLKLSSAIVGAGIGGMTAAATLRQIAVDVPVYEQAPRFARIGAGIQMMPNSMKLLRWIGVKEKVEEVRNLSRCDANRKRDSSLRSERRRSSPFFASVQSRATWPA
jgi:2-polyprenyl-6-methoxyphenol hydroxylase-like FAD-dependent oxidoreductase